MRIFEFFRKTKETYICSKINLDGQSINNIFVNISFLKHMINQFIVNSFINLYILCNGDINIDYHHFVEDLGITIGKTVRYSLKKINITRYGYSLITLDDCLSKVVLDLSGRSYLRYKMFYSKIFLGNFDVDLFYDFFLSFSNNSFINLHINNIYGENNHHKIETIFKALGNSFEKAVKCNFHSLVLKSTKGFF